MSLPVVSYILKVGRLDPILDAFLMDRSRVSVITGPLGSGKTFAAIARLVLQMTEQKPNAERVRPTRFIAVRNTYSDLMTTTIRDFREVFKEDIFGSFKGGGIEPPTFHVSFDLEDGTHVRSEVIFLALDRADSVNKLRGIQATGFWLNELKELDRAVVDMADLRHGRYPTRAAGGVDCGWHGMFGDTNACDTDHWLYHLAEEIHPKEWRFHRQPGGVLRTGKQDAMGREIFAVNPLAENLRNLPAHYYEAGMEGKKQDWIAVNLANEYGFSLDGKPVHPEYIDSIHCMPEEIPYDPTQPLIIGVDFGRTPAAALVQFQPGFGRYVAIDELVSTDMSQAVFGPELKRYIARCYPGARIRGWSDPAGEGGGQATEDTPRQVLVASGIPCQPAPSNAPVLRRAAIANPLMRNAMDGKAALWISPKCRTLRKGLAGAWSFRRMKISGQERYHEDPDKGPYSHVCEALEYALLGEGEGRAALLPADYDDRAPMQTTADLW